MLLTKHRAKAEWGSQIAGVVFLLLCIYMQRTYFFESAVVASNLFMIAMLAVTVSLILGVIVLPRWHGYVSIGLFAYAMYWISGPVFCIP
jgi:hypothetical protein